MNVDIICSDPKHPVNAYLQEWATRRQAKHRIQVVHHKQELNGGDVLLLISCHEIIEIEIRDKYEAALVIHASDLPVGRGWSPHIWQILEGKNEIIVSLIEAEDRLDSGSIWAQKTMHLEGHELADEIDHKLFTIEIDLIDYAIDNWGDIYPESQSDRGPTFYDRRTPDDSRLDPEQSLAEQFDLLRVADANRYPAFFDHRGHRYFLTIFKGFPDEE